MAVWLLAAGFVVPAAAPARSQTLQWLIPPVDAVVSAPFLAPASAYGAGHRGIDFDVPSGTAVRAAGSGTIAFAGRVAGVGAVTIAHEEGYESTYTDLDEIFVEEGETVYQAQWIGRAGRSHDGVEGLHFGLKLEDVYLDPAGFFGPIDSAGAVRLVPLEGEVPEEEDEDGCHRARRLGRPETPPNQNIAVAIAGIGSETQGGMSAEMYEHGPETLGYPEGRVYRFSYRSTRGPGFHEPYASTDTFGDLRLAAVQLGELMRDIGRKHPGAHVDILAHSQGGIVARVYLELLARNWEPGVPPVDHIVTFASPHGGAPAASIPESLDEWTDTGGAVMDAASWWARSGGPLPDPRSIAVEQMQPGSQLLDTLQSRDVLWGTQVLALGMPNDIVVPADRAIWKEKESRTLGPEGVWGHGAIVASGAARGLAFDFLQDEGPSCPGSWDLVGPWVGKLIGLGETVSPLAYKVAEEVGPAKIGRAGMRAGRWMWRGIRRLR